VPPAPAPFTFGLSGWRRFYVKSLRFRSKTKLFRKAVLIKYSCLSCHLDQDPSTSTIDYLLSSTYEYCYEICACRLKGKFKSATGIVHGFPYLLTIGINFPHVRASSRSAGELCSIRFMKDRIPCIKFYDEWWLSRSFIGNQAWY
jgi:hypothetical protein